MAPGGRDNRLKWKPDDENSIDFRLNLEFPKGTTVHPQDITTQTPYDSLPEATKWHLSVWAGGSAGKANYIPWGDLYLPREDWTKVQASAGNHGEVPLENAIVECNWDKHVGTGGRWRFMRFRRDKPNANFVDVAKKVQESIRDGVSKEELIKWAVDIKAGWRKRHPK
jgi:mRNA guanylyltransferase